MAKLAQKVAEGAARYVTAEAQGAELLLQNLDVWTAATRTKSTSGRGSGGKIELAGISKLRELILELAVRGKLVPQDPNDEPASILLERIQKEKARLIAEGKIKKQKALPNIKEQERPFDLPSGWCWARLQSISELITSGSRGWAQYYSEQGAKFITMSNLSSGSYSLRLDSLRFVTPPSNSEGQRTRLLAGDIVVSITGDVGNLGLIPEGFGEAYINQHSSLVRLCSFLKGRFLPEYLRSPVAKVQFDAPQRGVKNSFRLSDLASLVVALPPLKEQHRIVAKVDELMALCDQLEQQTEQQLDAHQQLVETLLGTLTQSQSADDLAANWQRLADHFDLLFSGPMGEWAVDRLKDTILQLAVMGKLVPQAPNDEPASVLLERIQQEKARLITEGKIKKQKPLPPISEEGKPFCLPDGWSWTKLADITDIQSGIAKGKKYNGQETVELPYLRVANVQRGYLILDEMKTIEILERDLAKYTVLTRDLLITEGGDWDKVGRTAIWTGADDCVLHQNHVFKARLIMEDQNEFWLEKYLNSGIARAYFAGSSKQTTNLASINKTQLSNCLVPVPPSKEQSRIIAKLNKLYELCDVLKLKMCAASEAKLSLSDTLVEQVLTVKA